MGSGEPAHQGGPQQGGREGGSPLGDAKERETPAVSWEFPLLQAPQSGHSGSHWRNHSCDGHILTRDPCTPPVCELLLELRMPSPNTCAQSLPPVLLLPVPVSLTAGSREPRTQPRPHDPAGGPCTAAELVWSQHGASQGCSVVTNKLTLPAPLLLLFLCPKAHPRGSSPALAPPPAHPGPTPQPQVL